MASWFKYGEVGHYMTPYPPIIAAPHGTRIERKKSVFEFSRMLSPSVVLLSFDVVGKERKREGLEYLAYLGCLEHLATHTLQVNTITPFLMGSIKNAAFKLHDCLEENIYGHTYPLALGGKGDVKQRAKEFDQVRWVAGKIRKTMTQFYEPPAYIWHFAVLADFHDRCRVETSEVQRIIGAYMDKLRLESPVVFGRTAELLRSNQSNIVDTSSYVLMAALCHYALLAFNNYGGHKNANRYYAVLNEELSILLTDYAKGLTNPDDACNTIYSKMVWALKKNKIRKPFIEELQQKMALIKFDFDLNKKEPSGWVDMMLKVVTEMQEKPGQFGSVVNCALSNSGLIIYCAEEDRTRGLVKVGNESELNFLYELIAWNVHYQASCLRNVSCPYRLCENVEGANCLECAGRFSAQTRRKICEECSFVRSVYKNWPFLLEIAEPEG